MHQVKLQIRPPKPAPLAVFAAEFSSAENLPKNVRLAEYANAMNRQALT